MNISIKTTTISLTPSISDYVEKHLEVLKKFLQDDPTVKFDLELAKTTNHHNKGDIFKAEIHIVGKDKNIYSSVEKGDLYAAIDEVKAEVLEKLKSTNEKNRSLLRKGGAQIKNVLKGLWNK
jgi:ribosomal subunit interface protein